MSNETKPNNQGWWVAIVLTAIVSYNYGHSEGEQSNRPSFAEDFAADAAGDASNYTAALAADRAVDAAAAATDNESGSVLATLRRQPDVEPPVEESSRPMAFVSAPEPEQSYVHYSNCSEARAAGDTPLYAGDPGYARRMDRDGDGVACE